MSFGFFDEPAGREFLGLAKSFLKAKESAETKPSSTSKITITKEAMREMLEHTPEWPIVVEAFHSDEFS